MPRIGIGEKRKIDIHNGRAEDRDKNQVRIKGSRGWCANKRKAGAHGSGFEKIW